MVPIEDALAEAVTRLGLQPKTVDLRQRLTGPLSILWANLVDMAPKDIKNRWGAPDVPEEWEELRLRLLRAVEAAIENLSYGRKGRR